MHHPASRCRGSATGAAELDALGHKVVRETRQANLHPVAVAGAVGNVAQQGDHGLARRRVYRPDWEGAGSARQPDDQGVAQGHVVGAL